jgi:hypothetical protein
MNIMKQLAIFMANKPGTLSSVCELLLEHNINILGIMVSDAVDHAVVRMVVDNPTTATHLLGERGILVVDSDIIALTLPNTSGQLFKFSRTFSEAGVNIEYLYGGLNRGDKEGVLFIKVSDIEKAGKALTGKAIKKL